MEAKAYLKHCRMSPRKVQVVLDLIRGQNLDKAVAILKYTPRAACEPVLKLVNSAAANAENNHGMNRETLYVYECFASPGPTLKRIRPRAKGRADRELKRTAHITVALKEREETGKGE